MPSRMQPSEPHDQSTASVAHSSTAMEPAEAEPDAAPSDLQAEPEPAGARSAMSLSAGALFGRYVVIGRLGTGGMGVVYAAYDPNLDRKVAIKVLTARKASSMAARARLVREARSLAKLSHPNVVQVHDAGEHNAHVFIAMEFIGGQSLYQFCRSTPQPSWRTVLKVYIDAARGLAAAHAAGLIHRDFKPANVLIGRDGRARVLDFGLALGYETLSSETGEAPPAAQDAASMADEAGGASGRIPSSERITVPGALMGTPAYMPPEQHSSADVGPLADQYSFCASLYEGLYGQLPFAQPPGTLASPSAGEQTPAALLRRKLAAQIARPASTDVPAWLHAVLVRGMAPKPAQRFPSMDALISALMNDPVAKRRARLRQGGVAVTTLAACGLAALGWLDRGDTDRGAVCTTAPSMLAGVWDAGVKETIRRGFLATGVPVAERAFARLDAVLTRYADDWARMSTAACEATWVHRRQSEHALDLRTSCLDKRLGRLRALTRLLAEGSDAETVHGAIQAAIALPPVASCSDLDALTRLLPLPEDPGERSRIAVLQARHDQVRSLYDAGKFALAYERGEALLAESTDLAYAPLRAEIMSAVADLRQIQGHHEEAISVLRDGLAVAARAKDDATSLVIWAQLVELIGARLARFDEMKIILPYAEAAFERTDDVSARGAYLRKKGLMLWEMKALDEALLVQERALALCREGEDGEDGFAAAESLNNIGMILDELDRHAEARAAYERSLAIVVKLFGEDHPHVASLTDNLAVALAESGELAKARSLHERALAIRERAYGPVHHEVAVSLNNLGVLLLRSGDFPAAQAALARSVDLFGKLDLAKHPNMGQVLANLSTPLVLMGKYDEALAVLSEAQGILVAAHGDRSPATAVVRSKLAVALAYLDRGLAPGTGRGPGAAREAEAAITQALALADELPDTQRAQVLVNAGLTYARISRPDLGRRYYERALAIQESIFGPEHPDVAETLGYLASLLVALGKHHEARAFGEKALAFYDRLFPRGISHAAVPLVALAEVELASGHPERALAYLDRAVALSEPSVHFLLADSRRLQARARLALSDSGQRGKG